MDLNASLNLEESYYQEGYLEGSRDGETQGLVEGRIYGSEVSYGRFLALGLLYGKVAVWKSEHADEARIMNHVEKVMDMLNSVPRDNNETAEGKDYETLMGLVVRKMKVIASLCGEMSLIKQEIVQESNATDLSGDLEDGAEFAIKLRGGSAKSCGN